MSRTAAGSIWRSGKPAGGGMPAASSIHFRNRRALSSVIPTAAETPTRRFLLFLTIGLLNFLYLETRAMRFEQRISSFLRSTAAIGLVMCLFASGLPVFASEQAPAAQPPTPAPAGQPQAPAPVGALPAPAQQAPVVIPGAQLQVSADEAVRMALENNLGIRAERLSPQ